MAETVCSLFPFCHVNLNDTFGEFILPQVLRHETAPQGGTRTIVLGFSRV